MELQPKLKNFIIENKELFVQNDFNQIYKKLRSSDLNLQESTTFTELMYEINIDPLLYLDNIPIFYLDNSSIKSFKIPNHIKSIGGWAFNSCTKLIDITIPDSVTSIGKHAFSNCSSLTSIIIPDGVTTIGYNAFSYCSNLTNIVIPDSVTSIGAYAFSYCPNLTSIVIPDNAIIIGSGIFIGCPNLKSIKYNGKEFTNRYDFYDYLKYI